MSRLVLSDFCGAFAECLRTDLFVVVLVGIGIGGLGCGFCWRWGFPTAAPCGSEPGEKIGIEFGGELGVIAGGIERDDRPDLAGFVLASLAGANAETRIRAVP